MNHLIFRKGVLVDIFIYTCLPSEQEVSEKLQQFLIAISFRTALVHAGKKILAGLIHT